MQYSTMSIAVRTWSVRQEIAQPASSTKKLKHAVAINGTIDNILCCGYATDANTYIGWMMNHRQLRDLWIAAETKIDASHACMVVVP